MLSVPAAKQNMDQRARVFFFCFGLYLEQYRSQEPWPARDAIADPLALLDVIAATTFGTGPGDATRKPHG